MHPADALTERLGLPIRDRDLLAQALVHSSWLHEHPDAARGHNERLEFLGDAVVSLAVSEALYRRHPADDEGVLSARRAAIVSTPGPRAPRGAPGPRLVPAPRRGRGPAWRPRPAVAPRLGVRGARRRHLPRPRLGGRPRLDPRAGRREEISADIGADDAQEPQEPAPGAHPAHDRRAARCTACSRRWGRTTRSSSGSRSSWTAECWASARARRGGSPRRPPPPRPSRSCAASARRPGRPARPPRRTGRRRGRGTAPRPGRPADAAPAEPEPDVPRRGRTTRSRARTERAAEPPPARERAGPPPGPARPGLQVLRRAHARRVRARHQRDRRPQRLRQVQPRRRAPLGARRAGPLAADPQERGRHLGGLREAQRPGHGGRHARHRQRRRAAPGRVRASWSSGRRLYRSGENDYLLNKQRVRLRDLQDLLDSANLAENAFLFIGQGMVDQALALRPEERRPLFEEVAGVRRHERRRRKAEDQLAEAEANLARVEDILAELRPAGPPPGAAGRAAGDPAAPRARSSPPR